MPPVKRLYSEGSAFKFPVRGKRRLTLKNSVSFVDESYPDLVFLIPKATAKLWRIAGCVGDEESVIEASVYVKRDGIGGSTWLLDLDSGARLTLKKDYAAPTTNTIGDGIKNKKHSQIQREIIESAAERGVDVVVESIQMSRGGRHADITLNALSS